MTKRVRSQCFRAAVVNCLSQPQRSELLFAVTNIMHSIIPLKTISKFGFYMIFQVENHCILKKKHTHCLFESLLNDATYRTWGIMAQWKLVVFCEDEAKYINIDCLRKSWNKIKICKFSTVFKKSQCLCRMSESGPRRLVFAVHRRPLKRRWSRGFGPGFHGPGASRVPGFQVSGSGLL